MFAILFLRSEGKIKENKEKLFNALINLMWSKRHSFPKPGCVFKKKTPKKPQNVVNNFHLAVSGESGKAFF